LYLTDPAHNLDDVNALKQAFKDAKGPGAFRNMFFYAPKGQKDGMQVIPVESAQAQDKFFEIKNVSRDDIMAAHRVYPNLLAVPATNAGGFGNILESRQAFVLNEIVPLAKMLATTHPVLRFNFPL
jgi:capsid portal protein